MRILLRYTISLLIVLTGLLPGSGFAGSVRPQQGGDAPLVAADGTVVRLTDSVGRVKLISIVPQLNTPVCDEQTHHVSERNEGLDRLAEIITLSTNSRDDQARFARKARISNIRFLSDAPAHAFGKQTGLLLPLYGILHRAVIVADEDNVVRYFQLVPTLFPIGADGRVAEFRGRLRRGQTPAQSVAVRTTCRQD